MLLKKNFLFIFQRCLSTQLNTILKWWVGKCVFCLWTWFLWTSLCTHGDAHLYITLVLDILGCKVQSTGVHEFPIHLPTEIWFEFSRTLFIFITTTGTYFNVDKSRTRNSKCTEKYTAVTKTSYLHVLVMNLN